MPTKRGCAILIRFWPIASIPIFGSLPLLLDADNLDGSQPPTAGLQLRTLQLDNIGIVLYDATIVPIFPNRHSRVTVRASPGGTRAHFDRTKPRSEIKSMRWFYVTSRLAKFGGCRIAKSDTIGAPNRSQTIE
jgi:hypothetical protein